MRLSVLIPSYRRSEPLARCLAALAAQQRLPDEVVVVQRADDLDTAQVCAPAASPAYPLRKAIVATGGAVAAYNAGLDSVSGDVVAIIDDDTEPHPDWLARIETAYLADPKLGGLGGRDIVHEHGRVVPTAPGRVGRVQWFGRMVGNHHTGMGEARAADFLKGANMSFRRAAIGATRFDTRLWGNGAQVHLEIGFCVAIRRKGWRIAYDPRIALDHFPSVRHDEDKRSRFSAVAQLNKAHNEQLAVLDALPAWGRAGFIPWGFALGTADVPGLVQALRLAARGDRQAWKRLAASWRGRAAGMRTWRSGTPG